MRLLVFGGWGQLGTELTAVCEGRHDLVRPPHAEVDVVDRAAVDRIVGEARPHAVVNMAAFHKVELCEADPGRAFAVNAGGAFHVAASARAAGARCVYVSSDYVFDGENPHGYVEDAASSPVNVYGVSKAAGERAVTVACPDSLVVRGSGVFGHAGSSGKGGNFVETMLSRAAAREPISVVDDQIFSPTAARDMAERMVMLLERQAPPGVYHLANAGTCSWFGFARAIFEIAGVDVDLRPRASDDAAVRRPRCSVLLDTRTAGVGLPAARPWREALAWYLRSR